MWQERNHDVTVNSQKWIQKFPLLNNDENCIWMSIVDLRDPEINSELHSHPNNLYQSTILNSRYNHHVNNCVNAQLSYLFQQCYTGNLVICFHIHPNTLGFICVIWKAFPLVMYCVIISRYLCFLQIRVSGNVEWP